MKIKEAIIVEGKYDKIRLSNLVDSIIIQTDGFRIFNDKQKRNMIKELAEKQGIIVLTDSDSAGVMIRNHIRSFVNPENVKIALIPDIYGKEKRKKSPSKEGKLGVEGIPDSVIIKALKNAGCTEYKSDSDLLTSYDLYELGIAGCPNSENIRSRLFSYFNLPEHTSTKMFLQYINSIMSKEEFMDEYSRIR